MPSLRQRSAGSQLLELGGLSSCSTVRRTVDCPPVAVPGWPIESPAPGALVSPAPVGPLDQGDGSVSRGQHEQFAKSRNHVTRWFTGPALRIAVPPTNLSHAHRYRAARSHNPAYKQCWKRTGAEAAPNDLQRRIGRAPCSVGKTCGLGRRLKSWFYSNCDGRFALFSHILEPERIAGVCRRHAYEAEMRAAVETYEGWFARVTIGMYAERRQGCDT